MIVIMGCVILGGLIGIGTARLWAIRKLHKARRAELLSNAPSDAYFEYEARAKEMDVTRPRVLGTNEHACSECYGFGKLIPQNQALPNYLCDICEHVEILMPAAIDYDAIEPSGVFITTDFLGDDTHTIYDNYSLSYDVSQSPEMTFGAACRAYGNTQIYYYAMTLGEALSFLSKMPKG